ncbi:MAG: hypothetical protein A2Y54_10045 [Chloroflexi bacterium RBG_16_51_16]|nr:MAG: hypothetical protein A2Y54_10045 [Chloroflexi bacterium RBG_16_51_16]
MPTALPTPVVDLAPVPVQPVVGVDLVGAPMEIGSTFRYVDGTLLVAVPGGESIQGAPHIPDNPEHVVGVSDFWAYATEVTNRQYMFCVSVGQCTPPDPNDNPVYLDPFHANDPVVGVIHSQGADYCEWVRGRYPTDAEWEKLARGPEGNTYPWGEDTPTCGLLNTAECVGEPTMVLNYPDGRSFYEAFDMSGNVYEWVADWYSPNYPKGLTGQDPLGAEFGDKRSVRSSGFSRSFFESESARRWSLKPEEHKNDLGFRCVVEDPFLFAPFCEQKFVFGKSPAGIPTPVGGGSPGDCSVNVSGTNHYCDYSTGNLWAQVQVNPPDASVDNAPVGCTEGPPGTWTCCSGASCPSGSWDGSDLQVHVDCDPVVPPDYTCPPGYDSSGNGCSAQGRPGACLAGTNYDPVNQCCSALTASGVGFGCPVGWYDTPAGCAPDPQAPGFDGGSGSPPFLAEDCTSTGDNDGDGDNGCPPGSSQQVCGRDQQGNPIYCCR